MSNFRFFSVITADGADIFSFPKVTTIKAISDKPVLLGEFSVSGWRIGVSDGIIIPASIAMIVTSFYIFRNKDLPI